ncbi:hypothetical protein EPVG_00323 [Emiliania huxleyi virus 201]|nr:hypothetical protein ELVG_00305 [Emiliania huxleyi virus 203]AEP15773.1 hypothetical protein EQVG_00364 [Emiliania huxleyi virus 207]AET98210.1 hypothetical protein EPVG_00323 [Emiliania huxleyi virus 201]
MGSGIVKKFKNMSTSKKAVILLVVGIMVVTIVVVGILFALGVIPKREPEMVYLPPSDVSTSDEPDIPDIPANDIVPGYFRDGGCMANLHSHKIPASSIENCRAIARNINGVIAVGFRNGNHSDESNKNTCFFYKCISPKEFYDRNDPVNANDTVHTMSCVNDAEVFEECV